MIDAGSREALDAWIGLVEDVITQAQARADGEEAPVEDVRLFLWLLYVRSV